MNARDPLHEDRRRRLTSSVVVLSVLLLSGSHSLPAPERPLGPRTAPPEFLRIEEHLRQRTGLPDAQIHEVARTILVEAGRANFDPELILAVIHVESSGDRLAISRVGALGLMQLRPRTARYIAEIEGIEWTSPEVLFDPVLNVRLGVIYLEMLVDRFGDLDTALAAYNWGPTHIAQEIRQRRTLPVRYTEKVRHAYRALMLI